MTTYVYKSTTGFPVNIDNYTITPNPGLYSKYQIEALDSAMGSTLSRYDDGVLATNDSNYPATFSLDINNNVTGLVGLGGAKYGGIVTSVDASSPSTIAQQIQALHDTLAHGGAIYIPPCDVVYEWTAQVTITKPVLIFSMQHKGGAPANAGNFPASATIRVAPGIKALQLGQASALFCGASVKNLVFISSDGSGWPIYVNNMSHVTIEDVSISGFTSGVGVEFVGNAGQYSRISRTYIHATAVGIKATSYNGIVIDGCYIDSSVNSATPVASSIGVLIANNSADTIYITNTQIQGCDVCIDTLGETTSIANCRFEIFNTGVILRGTKQTVNSGCSFNNYIYNSGGTCIDIKAGASLCEVFPVRRGATGAAVSDAGTNTVRRDGIIVTRVVDSVSATSSFLVGDVPENAGVATYYCRYAYLHTGDTSQAADGGNYWSVQMYKLQTGGALQGLNGALSSSGGWGTNSKQTFNTAVNNNALSAGEKVRVTFTKNGTPANITQASLTFLLVPY